MRRTVNLLIVLAAIVAAFSLPSPARACVGRTILIGYHDAPDQVMVANLLAVFIDERTGTTVKLSRFRTREEAFEAIRRGACDVVISGGTEATITPMGLGGFCAMKALSTRNEDPAGASRPFDKERDGFVMGEGAAILILEEMEFARRRGAKIYAELCGYGASADAYHVTAPSPGGEGAVRCMRAALADARVNPEDVEYVNAHGTSTPYNDLYETMAIRTAFGDHAKKLLVSSTKSMTGHLLGAAGAIESLFSVLAIRDGVVPPTINYTTPDPECDLDYVPNAARKKDIRYALSNSFGFGGTNSCLLFGRNGG